MHERIFIVLITILLSCNGAQKPLENNTVHESVPLSKQKDTIQAPKIDYTGPAAVVYKTKYNYNHNVPVILSDDKTKIISYPAPQDVYYNGNLALPTLLSKGYLLDNRGISKNVAFLNITYDEYSKLSQAPPLDKMMDMIIDKDPLLEMYNCGNRHQYKDEVKDLDKIIEGKHLERFKRIIPSE